MDYGGSAVSSDWQAALSCVPAVTTVMKEHDVESCEATIRELREAANQGCSECAYEVGIPLPSPAGLCIKHNGEREATIRELRERLKTAERRRHAAGERSNYNYDRAEQAEAEAAHLRQGLDDYKSTGLLPEEIEQLKADHDSWQRMCEQVEQRLSDMRAGIEAAIGKLEHHTLSVADLQAVLGEESK